ncbi:MAG: hypothetical protein KAU50_06260 [Candidatus Marinimicrobia bacterium]|nr:hypothetical protein [Candidatus Neomarinimicrobiota bacterium]
MILFYWSMPLGAQSHPLNVLIDCDFCAQDDLDYMSERIGLVQFVRDRADTDVHIPRGCFEHW